MTPAQRHAYKLADAWHLLDIPEGKSGPFEIRHDARPTGEVMKLYTERTAFIGEDERGAVKFDHPTRWHKLLEGSAQWMTDWPIEQDQQDRILAPIRRGTVVVGGLGLGYAAITLAMKPGVKRVVVVEISKHVIKLVGPHFAKKIPKEAAAKIEVVHADLFDYLNGLPLPFEGGTPHFDHAYYDIWASDGEGTFFDTVVPLRKLSVRRVRNEPICWNENVMRGQLSMGLQSSGLILAGHLDAGGLVATFPSEMQKGPSAKWVNWRIPFWNWVRAEQPKPDVVLRAAALYGKYYGLIDFEERWHDIRIALSHKPAVIEAVRNEATA